MVDCVAWKSGRQRLYVGLKIPTLNEPRTSWLHGVRHTWPPASLLFLQKCSSFIRLNHNAVLQLRGLYCVCWHATGNIKAFPNWYLVVQIVLASSFIQIIYLKDSFLPLIKREVTEGMSRHQLEKKQQRPFPFIFRRMCRVFVTKWTNVFENHIYLFFFCFFLYVRIWIHLQHHLLSENSAKNRALN